MSGIDDHAGALADAVDAALPVWVERSVDRVYREWAGPPPPAVAEAAEEAGQAARSDIGVKVRDLLATDIDAQRATPLSLLRLAVRFPTAVLADVGVPGVDRDAADAAMFPDDVYGLTPATFADIDPSLAEPGVAWGAAKAFEHRRRHVRRTVVYAPDLMDRSKITAAWPAAVVVRAPADVVEAAGAGVVVLVDLGRPGVLDAIGPAVERGARVVGFGSHVDRDTLTAAAEAGAEVMARSAFFGRLGEL